MSAATDTSRTHGSRVLVHRHAGVVRATHWVNLVCLVILLMSGLQIFNAHPALYWGTKSTFDSPALSMTAHRDADGQPHGMTTIGGVSFDTTGVLGLSKGANGNWSVRGFPAWATIPGFQALALGRHWHFLFAWLFVVNGALYLAYTLMSGHAWRDLVPGRGQLRHIGGAIRDHALLRFPKGEEARHYNVLQKLSYLVIIFIALPLMVLAGLAMSPGFDTVVPGLLDLFGGRQSARTIHFITAWFIVGFVLVHVVMVLVSGVWNNLRSMVTGRYAIRTEKAGDTDG